MKFAQTLTLICFEPDANHVRNELILFSLQSDSRIPGLTVPVCKVALVRLTIFIISCYTTLCEVCNLDHVTLFPDRKLDRLQKE